jgi:adenine-specific DNA-methyltransferase
MIVDNQLINLNQSYFTEQIITYLGNKRRLLLHIDAAIDEIKMSLGKKYINSFDGFSGSGIVSRLLKIHSEKLIVNDLEYYCYVINKCYLSNPNSIQKKEINDRIDYLNSKKQSYNEKGFVEKLYCPKNDDDIQEGERVFFTNENGKIIDCLRSLIKDNDYYSLSSLLYKVSINNNTSGVFKGFYKNTKTNKGQFGGNAQNALKRIKKQIKLDYPIFLSHDCETIINNKDINILVKDLKNENIDITYYDPPYNEHPYGSNYFMLNCVAKNEEPKDLSKVSGIPKDWNRSHYNKRNESIDFLDKLIKNTPSKYIITSYSSEGHLNYKEVKDIMEKYGKLNIKEIDYNNFRAARTQKAREKKIKEYLFILKVKFK